MSRGRFTSVALVVFLSLSVAGCLGGEDAPDDPPMTTERPGVLEGPEDAALSLTGRWEAPFDGEVPAINAVLLHDGRVLYWSGVEADPNDGTTDIVSVNTYPVNGQSRILDLRSGTPNITTPVNPYGAIVNDLFCSGQTILPDGRVLVPGGTEWGTIPEPNLLRGIQQTRIFDPSNDTWTQVDDLLIRRWYPSVITDDQGEALAIGGIDHWEQPQEQWSSWEQYDAAADAWNGVAGTESEVVLPLYPRIYEVAGGPLKGQFFADTAGALWAPFGEHPLQGLWNMQWAFDQDTQTWTDLGPSQYGVRSYPANVMLQLDPARDYAPEFLMYGGTLQQSGYGVAFAERTDLLTNPPTRIVVPDLAVARWHPFGVLLPDGQVLASGGAQLDNVLFLGTPEDGATLAVELYDPVRNSWRMVAPMTVERTYHSTALLLPDGRVLMGGHVPDPMIFKPWRDTIQDQIVETRFEIYEPGYLFRGDRPVIVDVPEAIGYGHEFTVDVELPTDLDGFLLVHPGATTHIFDGSVRHIALETLGQEGTNVTLRAPPDGIVAPPGDYMLFALSQHPDGPVPSVAAWVHLD